MSCLSRTAAQASAIPNTAVPNPKARPETRKASGAQLPKQANKKTRGVKLQPTIRVGRWVAKLMLEEKLVEKPAMEGIEDLRPTPPGSARTWTWGVFAQAWATMRLGSRGFENDILK